MSDTEGLKGEANEAAKGSTPDDKNLTWEELYDLGLVKGPEGTEDRYVQRPPVLAPNSGSGYGE